MSRFHFDESAASAVSASLNGIAENINTCKEQLNAVMNDLQYYDGFNIGFAFEQIAQEKNVNLPTCVAKVNKGAETISFANSRVRYYYEKLILSYESGLVGDVVQQSNGINHSDTTESKASKWAEFGKYAKTVIGKAGPMGGFLAMLKPAAEWIGTGFDNVDWSQYTTGKYMATVIKDGISVEKALLGLIGKEAGVAKWFGGTVGTVKPIWGDYIIKAGSSTVDKLKTGLSWAGLGLTATVNWIKNSEENDNVGRAIAETITETAIDTAKGWAIGAAVAAGGLPGLAVGSVIVGLDMICKNVTGKDVTEFTSDLILDVGKWGLNKIKNVGSDVVSGAKSVVSSATKYVSDGLSFIGSGIGRGFNALFA